MLMEYDYFQSMTKTCNKCGRSFVDKETYEKHMLIVEGIDISEEMWLYKCKTCTFTFKSELNLNEHMQICSQVFICDNCNEYFPETILKKHIKSCQNKAKNRVEKDNKIIENKMNSLCKNNAILPDNFSCNLCKFISKTEDGFSMHSNTKHRKCKLCSFQTIYKKNLFHHVKMMHAKNKMNK